MYIDYKFGIIISPLTSSLELFIIILPFETGKVEYTIYALII